MHQFIIFSMDQQFEGFIRFPSNSHFVSSEAEPWISEHTRSISNPIVRFHNQIIDFSIYVQPSQEQHALRLQILKQFENEMKNTYPQMLVCCPFLKNKLYLKNTELQIYVVVPSQETNWQQNALSIVQNIGEKIGLKIFTLSMELTEQECRIITEHERSKTQVWVRFVPQTWKVFIEEVDCCIANSIEIKYLYIIFFCLVRQRSLHVSIKSLFIYGICSFFVYERRKQRVRTLTQNVIKFLQFFSIGFSQDKERKIHYKEGNSYSYTMSSDKILSFEIGDKVDLAASRKVKQLIKIFQNRYRVLGNYYYPPGSSVLTHLVNPCSNKFCY